MVGGADAANVGAPSTAQHPHVLGAWEVCRGPSVGKQVGLHSKRGQDVKYSLLVEARYVNFVKPGLTPKQCYTKVCIEDVRGGPVDATHFRDTRCVTKRVPTRELGLSNHNTRFYVETRSGTDHTAGGW